MQRLNNQQFLACRGCMVAGSCPNADTCNSWAFFRPKSAPMSVQLVLATPDRVGAVRTDGASLGSPVAADASNSPEAAVGLAGLSGRSPCLPCANKAKAVCGNCGGQHETAKCPIPAEYDGNYHLDSGGTEPCNC